MSDTVLEKPATATKPAVAKPAQAQLMIVDCDIHPGFTTKDELGKFMPLRWRQHVEDYGIRTSNPFVGALPYPRMGNGMRQDSYPPDGGAPASNLEFMQAQLLDPLNIEFGLLHALNPGPAAFNLEQGNAVCAAVNDWQVDKWLSKDKRLKGGIVTNQDDVAGSIAEIERHANDQRFVQIAMVPRSIESMGRQRYWPIYELAESLDLPIGVHSAGYGTHTNSAGGWGSFYIEEHCGFANPAQTTIISMIFEGVFERFPKLKLVVVEGGFAWLAPLMWRMDREWERMKDEVPHLKMKPSEYVKRNIWLTTQPVEEPPNVRHMTPLLEWIGHDKLLFSTDYPHWDFDDPNRAFRVPMAPGVKEGILRNNALSVYQRLNK